MYASRKYASLLLCAGVVLTFAWMQLRAQSPAPVDTPAQTAASAATIPAATAPSVAASSSTAVLHKIVRVVDGDTVVVELNGTPTTLRLIGLDTPEVVDPRKPVQCFGIEASDRAKELLMNTSVRIEHDESQGILDKYGRTLAYIFLPDGTNFAQRMIAGGYAHEYTYRLPYKYQPDFKAAEKAARESRRGLWADERCAAESARS